MTEVPHESKQCGARAKSNNHQPCKRIARQNGRCHLHGGKSTGAKTQEGKLKQKMARWKHGYYSKEALEERRLFKQIFKDHREYLSHIPI